MFQRLQKNFSLDFLDNKIAEEQEKQRLDAATKSSSTASTSTKRAQGSADGTRRPNAKPGTTHKTGAKSKVSAAKGPDAGPAVRGPDPDDFAIGEDSAEVSRSATPKPPTDGSDEGPASAAQSTSMASTLKDTARSGDDTVGEGASDDQLPLAVRQKLAKLETLTSRYQDLLRNYRTAHAHVAAIEPFEAILREHTSLTSISDPAALVEFLTQKDLQKDMAMQELKRLGGECRDIAKERDELKSQVEELEKKGGKALDGAVTAGDNVQPTTQSEVEPSKVKDTPSFSKAGKPADDDFFSYDEEVARSEELEKQHASRVQALEAEVELQKQQIKDLRSDSELRQEQHQQLKSEAAEHEQYINELSTENATLLQDLEMTRLDLSAMNNKIRLKEDGIKDLESRLKQSEAELREARKAPDSATVSEQSEADKGIEKAARDDKRVETLQNLVKALRDQLKTSDAESKDLHFKISLLESEARSRGTINATLRDHEEAAKSLQRRLAETEAERDAAKKLAQSKTGHEAAAANLRIQLNRALEERDGAYKMILACRGKCSEPEKDQSTNDSLLETSEVAPASNVHTKSDPTADNSSVTNTEASGNAASEVSDMLTSGETKKNKKKKSKAKRKAVEDSVATQDQKGLPTLDDLIRDPKQGAEIMLRAKHGDNPILPLLMDLVERLTQTNDMKDEELDNRCTHLEGLVELRDQTIKDLETRIREKDDEISTLLAKVEGTKSIEVDGNNEGSRAKTDSVSEAMSGHADSLKNEAADMHGQIQQLRERLEGESKLNERIENLAEENEMLKESLLENGKSATDALHELKELKAQKAELQASIEKLQEENAKDLQTIRDHEKSKQELSSKCAALEAKINDSASSADSNSELKSVQSRLRSVLKEREELQSAKDTSDRQIEELKAQHGATNVEMEGKQRDLAADAGKFKAKTLELEKELAAANQLAQTRYKDLTETRTAYNKLQPELKKLREESAEFKAVQAELDKANASIKRLEAKEKDLRSEIAEYKARLATRDAELSSLKDKAKKGEERSKALEESYETARKDLIASERTRDQAVEIRESLQANVQKLEEELKRSKSALDVLEKKVHKHSTEASGLREQLQLKSAQQASAQSLMDSMRDQTSELSIQMKEVREQKESLEEELADANRLLSERSREAETMRRLLTDVEGRAESRVKEMREKMDLAIEERDRAEDEASNVAKRRAREIEDYKLKLHDAERESARATEARREAEKRVSDLQERQSDLQRQAAQAQEELTEVRTAMAQLRDALDEGERQSRHLEREKAELRKTLDDKEARLERLQKSSKAMAEELRILQQQAVASAPATARVKPSPRPSIESARVASPASTAKESVDFVYLKNILLQFLEQKEKKHQMQLVPVLGMLLHFDRAEEQKWMTAISAK